MPVGISTLYRVEQHTPRSKLALDDTYFRIRLHEQQLYFPGNFFQQADHAVVSTAIESTFQPQMIQGLYKVAMVGKNVPVGLGISTNLTDWLPARASDSVHLSLKYTLIQGAPLTKLITEMDKIGLASEVSLLNADWAVAVKVSQIVGRLLDFLSGAGGARELLVLTLDLNVSALETGYYAVVGSTTNEYWPPRLEIDASGRLADPQGNSIAPLSYAVVEVLSLPRRGFEKVRDEAWWEVLQAGKDQALLAQSGSKKALDQAWAEWQKVLGRVRPLSRKSRALLQREIDDLIRAEHVEVQRLLFPGPTKEADTALPHEWQQLLVVRNERELYDAVHDYKDALARSKQLIDAYA